MGQNRKFTTYIGFLAAYLNRAKRHFFFKSIYINHIASRQTARINLMALSPIIRRAASTSNTTDGRRTHRIYMLLHIYAHTLFMLVHTCVMFCINNNGCLIQTPSWSCHKAPYLHTQHIVCILYIVYMYIYFSMFLFPAYFYSDPDNAANARDICPMELCVYARAQQEAALQHHFIVPFFFCFVASSAFGAHLATRRPRALPNA